MLASIMKENSLELKKDQRKFCALQIDTEGLGHLSQTGKLSIKIRLGMNRETEIREECDGFKTDERP